MDPAAGVAVSVTDVPPGNANEHVAPQLMPAGTLVTVPVPAPARMTVSVCDTRSNWAFTVVAAVTVTTHVPVPEQPPPLQPMKFEPALAAAVSVTIVPETNGAVHVAPQVMPAGALVTVPAPVPDFVTVRLNDC